MIKSFIWLDDPSSKLLRTLDNPSWRISLTAILAASAIATNYMMMGATNIKLMDFIVFVSGYLLGSGTGAFTGVLVWLVYGTLNPYGFSLPVFIATTLCETMYGLAGGLFASRGNNGNGFSIWAAVTGFLVTFVYDLVTNIVSGYSVGIPVSLALVTGIPFMLAHTISNAVFFGVGFSPLTGSINKVFGEKVE